MTLIWILIFIASLYILSKAADYFTDSAERIGDIFKMPPFVTGILIVALGTSLPELVTSLFGVAQGEAAILSGNVLGSTIANVFLGLGLVVVITRKVAKFNWDSVSNDMPFLISAIILLVLTIADGMFSFYEAILFLLGYIIYVVYSMRIRKLNRKEIRDDLKKELRSHKRENQKEFDNKNTKKEQRTVITVLIFIISLIFVIVSAKYVVNSVIALASIFGLGTGALAASIIAMGTSLPEISVAIASAKKGNFDMVIGNIMGSNIFNILVVFGIIGLFTNIAIDSQILTFILPMAGAAILIQWLITMDKKITVTEGLMTTLLYIAFIAKLFKIF